MAGSKLCFKKLPHIIYNMRQLKQGILFTELFEMVI